MMKFAKSVGVVLGLLLAQPSIAATTTYTNSADFTAVLTASVVDDYSDPGYVFVQGNAAMSGVLGETEYTSTGFTDWNIVDDLNYYCAGCNGSFILGFTSTSVGSSNGVFGVGFNFFNTGSQGFLYTALVTFGDGSTANYALPQVSDLAFNGFFGLTTDKYVASIAFGVIDGRTTVGGGFGIDNLTIGSGPSIAPIPLPAGGLLLLTALATLGWSRRRRA